MLLGGIEFYDKADRRINLIRKLHPKGKSYFDEYNNSLDYILQQENSATACKKRCEEALDKLNKGEMEDLPAASSIILLFKWI